jgi:GntR family transcriptional repressor for pyruvate dehydrogenase complex
LFKLIGNQSIVETIVSQISDAIITGQLRPGDKIPTEAEMMQSLGVGRNSVREAIKMLSALGVIEIRRGDGTYINDHVPPSIFDSLIYSILFDKSSKEEILELREAIEINILELAIEKAVPTDIVRLESLLDAYHQAYFNNRIEESVKLDLEFHYAIIEIARNPLLGRIAKGVLQLFYTSIRRKVAEENGREKLRKNETHAQMIHVIRQKDKQSARSVIRHGMEEWKPYI